MRGLESSPRAVMFTVGGDFEVASRDLKFDRVIRAWVVWRWVASQITHPLSGAPLCPLVPPGVNNTTG
jgi:hypothetical protein